MRLKQLYTILLLCCVNICFAQNKLFDKYADMDDVTSVYISKKMFQMMPVMETAGLNLANLKGKIEGLQVLTTPANTHHPKSGFEGTNARGVQSLDRKGP